MDSTHAAPQPPHTPPPPPAESPFPPSTPPPPPTSPPPPVSPLQNSSTVDQQQQQQQHTDPEFGQPFHCDSCTKDISYTVRIRCAECVDFDLCVDCFAKGTEIPGKPHRRTHPYSVVQVLDFPILEPSWGADEELMFLKAVDSYGLGNWEQVAEQIPFKNRLQVGRHYDKVYIHSPLFPTPAPVRDETTGETVDPARRLSLLRKEPPLVSRPEPAPASKPDTHEVQGYMPKRNEFATDYDQDAEQYTKDLEFKPEDTEQDRELKFAAIDIYNTALNRRTERKKFIHDRGLIDYRQCQYREKQLGKEYQELLNKMKVFAKMQTKDDFDTMMSGLNRELYLRQRIMLLQEGRRMGLRTLDELKTYLNEKQVRYQKQRLSFNTPVERSSSRHASRQQHHKNDYTPYNNGGGSTTDSMVDLTIANTNFNAGSSSASTPSNAGSSTSSMMISGTGVVVAGAAANNAMGNNEGSKDSKSGKNVTIQPAATGSRPAPQPLDVSNADGVELLMEAEREMCSALRIYPKAYMVIKETILREYATKGVLRRRQARELIKMDVNKTSKVYDFFVQMGWIKFQGR